MSKKKPVTWYLKIKGFGPFDKGLDAALDMSSSKAAVYAGNGQGKTAISRLLGYLRKMPSSQPLTT